MGYISSKPNPYRRDFNESWDVAAKQINEDLHAFKSKRFEENYKLVFKRGLKFLIQKFKAKRHLKLKKLQTERLFLQHYFGAGVVASGKSSKSKKSKF